MLYLIGLDWISFDGIGLKCAVLYCIWLKCWHCLVLQSIGLYCSVLCFIVLRLDRGVFLCIALDCTKSCCIVVCCVELLCCIVLQSIVLSWS